VIAPDASRAMTCAGCGVRLCREHSRKRLVMIRNAAVRYTRVRASAEAYAEHLAARAEVEESDPAEIVYGDSVRTSGEYRAASWGAL